MAKCIFTTSTGIGSGFNRDPFPEEFMVDISPNDYAWFDVYPERYQYIANQFTERHQWAAEVAAREAIQDAELAELQARLDEIETAQNSTGLRNITVSQAQAWINGKMHSSTTVADVKEAIREILLKIVPYILK